MSDYHLKSYSHKFPDDWELITLKDYILPCTEKSDYSDQYPVLTSSRKGLFFQQDYYNRIVASKDNTGYNVVPRGFFTYRHMSDDEVFKFNINDIADKGIVSTLYPVFELRNGIDKYFLQMKLNEGIEFRIHASTQKQGGSRTYMYLSKLSKLKIFLPPLPEQRKIAAILSSVDEAIQATQKVIDQTEKVKQGLLQELLTKGIGHTEFKMTEIGELPVGWEIVKLKNIVIKSKGTFSNGPFGSDLLKSELKTCGVPIIYIKDIKTGDYAPKNQVFVTTQKADYLSASEVLPDDVLFTKVGDHPCIPCIFPKHVQRAIITQDVIRMRVDKNIVNPHFVKAFFDSKIGSDMVEKIAIQGTRKRVSLGQFKELIFPLPTIAEQGSINKAILNSENLISNENHKLMHLFELKNGLIQDLLTGNVRVTI